MNKIVSRGLWGVFFVVGLSALGATAANAAETNGETGTASGTQGVISLGAPINVGGNAISILGDSSSSDASSGSTSTGSATTAPTTTSAPATTSGGDATLGGTQAIVTSIVPITAGGNAVSVLGDSSSSGAMSASTMSTQSAADEPTTTGEDGAASGTQVAPLLIAPVGASGNAISVLGDSESTGGTSTGSDAVTTTPATGTEGSGTAGADTAGTTGNDGVISGTQLLPTLAAPIALNDNAISALGDSGTPAAVDPGTAPTTPVTVPAAATAGGTMLAGLAATRLAYTGSDAAPALAGAFMALLAGAAATLIGTMKRRAL